MKKYLALIILFFALGNIKGQTLPNSDFESWTYTASDTVPIGWASSSGFGENWTTDAHSGVYAVSLWNWYWYAQGLLVNGDQSGSWNVVGGGTPISSKPLKLTGWYKYMQVPLPTDSAVVEIILKKYNAISHTADTIGYGITFLGSSDNYQYFEAPITDWSPLVTPDSIIVRFKSSDHAFCDTASTTGWCAYFNVDAVALVSPAGILIPSENIFGSSVSPNPVDDITTITTGGNIQHGTLIVIDVAGKLISKVTEIAGSSFQIDAGSLHSGVYFYSFEDGEKIVARGRLMKL